MALFNMDGPLMRGLSKIADLIVLNILTLICCIPVFTAGAAFTALHYQCLKIVRDEECYIAKGYFKSFKENFKQATIIWLLMLFVFGVFAADLLVMYYAEVIFPFFVRAVILVLGILTLCTAMFVFPLQARFANPVKRTIVNAFKASMLQFPKTLVMIILMFIPPVLLILFGNMIPLVIMTGFSFHAYLCALMYNKFFKRIEAQFPAEEAKEGAAQESGEDERIFHDELDPALAAGADEEIR